MNIGEVAGATGLPAKTIRYYEDIGLITTKRAENGYRAFGEAELHKLAFVSRARALGFSLDDCRALLSLYEDRSRASSDVRQLAEATLSRVEARIAELEAMRATLSTLVNKCQGDDRPDCPILEDLAERPS